MVGTVESELAKRAPKKPQFELSEYEQRALPTKPRAMYFPLLADGVSYRRAAELAHRLAAAYERAAIQVEAPLSYKLTALNMEISIIQQELHDLLPKKSRPGRKNRYNGETD